MQYNSYEDSEGSAVTYLRPPPTQKQKEQKTLSQSPTQPRSPQSPVKPSTETLSSCHVFGIVQGDKVTCNLKHL